MENNNFENKINSNQENEETANVSEEEIKGETAAKTEETASDENSETVTQPEKITVYEEPVYIHEEPEPSYYDTEAAAIFVDNDNPYANKNQPQKNGIAKFVVKAVAIIAIALVAGIVFGTTSALTSKIVSSQFKITTTETLMSKSSGGAVDESDVATIAENCMPSIVTITNMSVSNVVTLFGAYQQESQSSGSGIVIGKNDTELLIVTNHHVIANSTELNVIFSYDEHLKEESEGQTNVFAAQVKGYNADKDLAVIAVKLSDVSADTMNKIAIATIGDSSQMRPGDRVVAIGNALGYGQSVTTGIISAVDRELATEGENSQEVKNKFIQTDAAINPGNSGGALLNMRGELIGINSVKIAASGVEGMGYAIPITDVEEIIGELMVKETREIVEDENNRGYLGISGRDVSSSVSEMYGIPAGVYVESVEEGLAADKAGIKHGYIITKFDGTTVSTIAQLQDRLKYYRGGEKVNITVKIMGEGEYLEKELEITLSSKKDSKANEE